MTLRENNKKTLELLRAPKNMNHRGTERTETIAKVKEKRFFSLGDLCVSVVNVIFFRASKYLWLVLCGILDRGR